MDVAPRSDSLPTTTFMGLRAYRRFQEFMDTYPDMKKRPLRLLRAQTDVCWLEDTHGRHRVALRSEDHERLPADGLWFAVNTQGLYYVVGVCDSRVIAAVPVLGALGSDTIPRF